MTNEELAIKIKAGESEYINELWLAVEKFIRSQARIFYNTHKLRCQQTSVEVDDLTQAGYFALIRACESYKPEYAYLTILGYHLKSQFCECAKMRSTGWQNNTTYQAQSLDDTLYGDSEITLLDTLPDERAENEIDQIAERDYQEHLHTAFTDARKELTPAQDRAIIGLYYNGLSYRALAKRLNIEAPSVNNSRAGAFVKFRRNAELRALAAM